MVPFLTVKKKLLLTVIKFSGLKILIEQLFVLTQGNGELYRILK